jgi:hypothetical protein
VAAYQAGELEPIQVEHADIDQDDGNLGFEEMLKRLRARLCLDQILAEIL